MTDPIPTHGGKRIAGPGKKLGRPKKKVREKAHTMTIVLSTPAKARNLRRLARKAKLTPGAYVEQQLQL